MYYNVSSTDEIYSKLINEIKIDDLKCKYEDRSRSCVLIKLLFTCLASYIALACAAVCFTSFCIFFNLVAQISEVGKIKQ